MEKVLSFEQYTQRANESGLFKEYPSSGDNLPPGHRDEDYEHGWEERDIEPLGSPKHKLKLIKSKSGEYATNSSDVALLEGPDGEKYIWYWGSHLEDPDLWEGTTIYDNEIDENSVEVAANRLQSSDFGRGIEDWETENKPSSEMKQIVEIDPELAEELIDWLDEWMKRVGDRRLGVIKQILVDHLENSDKSYIVEEFGMDENTDSEISWTAELMEAEGIHPAIRQKLSDYLKDNPDATYPEAKRFIGKEIAGWKLSEEDFEEAKKMM